MQAGKYNVPKNAKNAERPATHQCGTSGFRRDGQNEPNGMLLKTHSKPKNRLLGNFTIPFYAKRTQWYVIKNQISFLKNEYCGGSLKTE